MAATIVPTPIAKIARRNTRTATSARNLTTSYVISVVQNVGLAGVEPATSPLSGVRSNQLSYSPERVTDSSGAIAA